MRRLCAISLAPLLLTALAVANTPPAFSLDTEADFESALVGGAGNVMMMGMNAGDWVQFGPAFSGVGGSAFSDPTLYASPPVPVALPDGNIILPDGMGMSWGPPGDEGDPVDPGSYVTGWKLDYAVDPNLLGATLIVDAMPPVFSPATGLGINTLGIGLVDANGFVRSWTFGVTAPPPPPTPGNLVRNNVNFMQIQVAAAGAGAAADAMFGLTGPAGPFPFDSATYFDNGLDPTQVISIIGIENGLVPQGGTIPAPPPGQAARAQWNWWGVVAVQPQPVIPEPITLLAAGMSLAMLGKYVRKRC